MSYADVLACVRVVIAKLLPSFGDDEAHSVNTKAKVLIRKALASAYTCSVGCELPG